MIKSPKFWSKKNHFLSFCFLPLSLIYQASHVLIRKFTTELSIKVPTICVGNLTMGGNGKTPVVNEIRRLLTDKSKFKKIFILSRGYNASMQGPHLVLDNDHAHKVGDEALLHRENGPVCVSKNKKEGAKFCVKEGADLLILDDGFQSKNIKKDISFIVIDSTLKFGNERIFPSGPLREGVKYGLSRADAIIYIKNNKKKLELKLNKKVKIFNAIRKIEIKGKVNKNIYAFCGIGIPENFFKSLSDLGLNIICKKTFPDHHKFLDHEIENIIKISKEKNLQIITTSKDLVKINVKFKKEILFAKLSIHFESEKEIINFIKKKILIKTSIY